MDMQCGCKGIRSCLVCDKSKSQYDQLEFNLWKNLWSYCLKCKSLQPPTSTGDSSDCTCHEGNLEFLQGIDVIPNFISPQEEIALVQCIEASPWKLSQSGRRKQDFGPKVNFKRRKLKLDGFTGLPSFSRPLVSRMNLLPLLEDFRPIEQCHLEYTPERGSSIDAHFDDWWVWGERLVTINLLSDSYLVFELSNSNQKESSSDRCNISSPSKVKVPMPRCSLTVVRGDARYKWTHAIPREAIKSRRIAVTFRELASEFLPCGTQSVVGEKLLRLAETYNGIAVP